MSEEFSLNLYFITKFNTARGQKYKEHYWSVSAARCWPEKADTVERMIWNLFQGVLNMTPSRHYKALVCSHLWAKVGAEGGLQTSSALPKHQQHPSGAWDKHSLPEMVATVALLSWVPWLNVVLSGVLGVAVSWLDTVVGRAENVPVVDDSEVTLSDSVTFVNAEAVGKRGRTVRP